MNLPGFPRLLGDVGGTNARFALQHREGIGHVQVLRCADFASLQQALRHYLQGQGVSVRHAALGIANPVHSDSLRMTNHHWNFSVEQVRAELGLQDLLVINDFAAQALALPVLPDHELQQVGGGRGVPGAARVVLGAGTGLGVGALLPAGKGRWQALAGEGGHVSFSPADEQEVDLWRHARQLHGHVSAERLLSGSGLELIHRWLGERAGGAPARDAAAITRGALHEGDELCRQTVRMFCGMLGTLAGNLALTLDARAGVYVGGGIVPRIAELFAASPFRQRFESKGRFTSTLAEIPVYVIHSAWPGLLGAGAALQQHLQGLGDA